jgi:hypothetical protein
MRDMNRRKPLRLPSAQPSELAVGVLAIMQCCQYLLLGNLAGPGPTHPHFRYPIERVCEVRSVSLADTDYQLPIVTRIELASARPPFNLSSPFPSGVREHRVVQWLGIWRFDYGEVDSLGIMHTR